MFVKDTVFPHVGCTLWFRVSVVNIGRRHQVGHMEEALRKRSRLSTRSKKRRQRGGQGQRSSSCHLITEGPEEYAGSEDKQNQVTQGNQ